MGDSAAHGTFEEAIQSFEPEIQGIARALRARIVSIHADFVEIAWPRQKIASYGIAPKKMSEHYAYIAPFQHHVNLGFYHGVAVTDPGGLLEGAGQRLRHVKIRSLADVGKNEISGLLKAALQERKKALRRT
jgi:hypothetical protein